VLALTTAAAAAARRWPVLGVPLLVTGAVYLMGDRLIKR
jgi:hypothetical protein